MAKKKSPFDWIEDDTDLKAGSLRKELGAKPGKDIPAGKLAKGATKPGVEGKRARLAETFKKMDGGKKRC